MSTTAVQLTEERIEKCKAKLKAMMANPLAAEVLLEIINGPKKHAGGRPKGSPNRGVCVLCGCKGRRKDSPPWEAKDDECRCEEPLTAVSKLDKAIEALNVRRMDVVRELPSKEERKAWLRRSEDRVARLATRNWKWYDEAEQAKLVKAGFLDDDDVEAAEAGTLPEEVAVVVEWRQSEWRPGMSKTAPINDTLPVIGAGYEYPTVPVEPTKKERDKGIEPKKPGRRKRSRGYVTDREGFVGDDMPPREPVELWGVNVEAAMQEVIGLDPIKTQRSKRSWLAPINADGSNGVVEPEIVIEDGKLKVSLATAPTLGECRAGYLHNTLPVELAGAARLAVPEAAPADGDAAEKPDFPSAADGGRRIMTLPAHYQIMALRQEFVRQIGINCLTTGGTRLVAIDAACVVPEQVKPKRFEIIVPRYPSPQEVRRVVRSASGERWPGWVWTWHPGALHRGASERRSGLLECRWRNADWREEAMVIIAQAMLGKLSMEECRKAVKKAKKWHPPEGFVQEPPVIDQAAVCLEANLRAMERRLPFIPLEAVQMPKPKPIVWHTTTRSIWTPQIKEAVMAVYGRPLPRSPLLPR